MCVANILTSTLKPTYKKLRIPIMKSVNQIQAYIHNLKLYFQLYLSNKDAYAIIKQVREQKLTYLEPNALVDLYERVREVEKKQLNGILVEAGCALGGSSLVMASAKEQARPFFIYDAFEMIPPPTESDDIDAHMRYEQITSGQAVGIKGGTYYGYQGNLLDQVKTSFQTFNLSPNNQNVRFVKGFYEDMLHIDQNVALAHLDCDWYDSVMTCLKRIEPHLVRQGILIIDDYYNWSGCKKAVDTYFEGREDEFAFEMKSRLHITRI